MVKRKQNKLKTKSKNIIKRYSCKICGNRFQYPTHVRTHIKRVHHPVWKKCDIDGCNKQYKQDGHLKGHKARTHKLGARYICEICDEHYWYESNFKDHELKHGVVEELYYCDECDRDFTRNDSLTRHVKTQHTALSRDFHCPNKCGASFKTKNLLGGHLRYDCKLREINESDYILCQIKDCSFDNGNPYKTTDKRAMKRHLAKDHKIGEQKCQLCNSKYCDSIGLKEHLARDHNIGSRFYCECGEQYYSVGKYKRHRRDAHNEVLNWYECEECPSMFKDNNALIGHVKYVHNGHLLMDIKCPFECGFLTKREGSMKSHVKKFCKKNPNQNRVTLYCDECEHNTTNPYNLEDHKARMHDGTIEIINCEYCCNDYKGIYSYRKHIRGVHDIGDKECQLCVRKCGKLHDTIIDNKSLKICKICHNKLTGYKTRIEKVVVEYMKEHFHGEIMKQDQFVRGEACLPYKPDTMYGCIIGNRILYIEIDEHEHKYNSHYKCDEKRMSDLYDETPGYDVVFIRFNPHNYNYEDKSKKITDLDAKLKMLINVMEMCSDSKNNPSSPLSLIYMFYSKNNSILAQNISYEMIQTREDLEKFKRRNK